MYGVATPDEVYCCCLDHFVVQKRLCHIIQTGGKRSAPGIGQVVVVGAIVLVEVVLVVCVVRLVCRANRPKRQRQTTPEVDLRHGLKAPSTHSLAFTITRCQSPSPLL